MNEFVLENRHYKVLEPGDPISEKELVFFEAHIGVRLPPSCAATI